MLRFGSQKAFDPPCEFVPQMAEPRSVRFFHYDTIDLNAMAGRLAARWPAGQVRIQPHEEGATLIIEPLAGRIGLYTDTGDERTLAVLCYDQRYAVGIEEAIQGLLAEGFTEMGREGFA
jgi:hypothetical protein